MIFNIVSLLLFFRIELCKSVIVPHIFYHFLVLLNIYPTAVLRFFHIGFTAAALSAVDGFSPFGILPAMLHLWDFFLNPTRTGKLIVIVGNVL